MDHGAILMLSFLAAVFVLFFWRVLLALMGIGVLLIIFVGVLTILNDGHLLNGS